MSGWMDEKVLREVDGTFSFVNPLFKEIIIGTIISSFLSPPPPTKRRRRKRDGHRTAASVEKDEISPALKGHRENRRLVACSRADVQT